jgi:peptidoglycan/xylan/chitin deacetylase (PgdA/CDA1 family)
VTKPLASLSLDLDNLWSYQMTHGDPTWDRYDSFLDVVVPRFLEELARLDLRITVFIVGKDASIARNHDALRAIADAGHEIGNHSFRHQPWLHRYTRDEIDQELADAEAAIREATGRHTFGFRGPGYSLSPDVLSTLVARGYEYDCSTLPTLIGPLARRYYFRSAKLEAEQRAEREYLFGSWREGIRPLRPYWWQVGPDRLLEIPVTVLPYARVPFHASYVLYIAGRSPKYAVRYFSTALQVCRTRHVEPSILLHPLDFLGADDVDELAFFPGMEMTGAAKRPVVRSCLEVLAEKFDVVPMGEHAAAIKGRAKLDVVSSSRAEPAVSARAPQPAAS